MTTDLICWHLLSTQSRRAMLKVYKPVRKRQRGYYAPRRELIDRLSRQLFMSPEAIRSQLHAERKYLLQLYYAD